MPGESGILVPGGRRHLPSRRRQLGHTATFEDFHDDSLSVLPDHIAARLCLHEPGIPVHQVQLCTVKIGCFAVQNRQAQHAKAQFFIIHVLSIKFCKQYV